MKTGMSNIFINDDIAIPSFSAAIFAARVAAGSFLNSAA